jgi:WD40 repeat protein
VHSVAFSQDGKHIVSGSEDNTIRVWDAETGDVVSGPFEGHSGGVAVRTWHVMAAMLCAKATLVSSDICTGLYFHVCYLSPYHSCQAGYIVTAVQKKLSRVFIPDTDLIGSTGGNVLLDEAEEVGRT